MAPSTARADGNRPVLLLEPEAENPDPFRSALSTFGRVEVFHDLATFLANLADAPNSLGLIDTSVLLDAPSAFLSRLNDFSGQRRVALVTSLHLEDYISNLGQWGITQSFSRNPPIHPSELAHFLQMVEDPAAGFGLIRYLDATIEMYCLQIRNPDEKNHAIERVINHFATAGFDVHRLYNVRLVLEETINNALFHAFIDATGQEKYSLSDFEGLLDPQEIIKIEYGSDHRRLGFSVTDSAGTLTVPVVLSKFERQLKSHGIFDQYGRGLYLSRLLTSNFVINIEPHARTQIVALFDDRGESNPAKPFLLNWAALDVQMHGIRDPDLDE